MTSASETASIEPTAGAPGAGAERRTIAVVATAHGCSHFFHLIVAPLFPWIKTAFDLTYAELGLLMSVFFVVSGVVRRWPGFWSIALAQCRSCWARSRASCSRPW